MNTKKTPTPVNSTEATIKAVAFIITFVLVIILVVYACSDGDEEEVKIHTPTDALFQSRQFVEQRLISPGSAEWPIQSDQTVQVNDTTFIIASHVDSQNKMGGLLRTYYKCDIVFVPSAKKVLCNNLVLQERE